MKEIILAGFFEGTISGVALANDVEGSEKHTSELHSTVEIEDMREEFTVNRNMAMRLCDAVLNNELPPESLANIGFALMASDTFSWEGDDVLASIIADWASPEINYDLTLPNVEKFRSWLLGTEEYPARPTSAQINSSWGKLISVKRKIHAQVRQDN